MTTFRKLPHCCYCGTASGKKRNRTARREQGRNRENIRNQLDDFSNNSKQLCVRFFALNPMGNALLQFPPINHQDHQASGRSVRRTLSDYVVFLYLR